jgi:hypothetical protein
VVLGDRLAEMPEADERGVPLPVKVQDARDCQFELLDVVALPLRTEATKVRQISPICAALTPTRRPSSSEDALVTCSASIWRKVRT